jgi:hypothetical protein
MFIFLFHQVISACVFITFAQRMTFIECECPIVGLLASILNCYDPLRIFMSIYFTVRCTIKVAVIIIARTSFGVGTAICTTANCAS